MMTNNTLRDLAVALGLAGTACLAQAQADYSFYGVADFLRIGDQQLLLKYLPAGGFLIVQPGEENTLWPDYDFDIGFWPNDWSLIDAADVTGDRRADVILRRPDGFINVQLSRSDGAGYISSGWTFIPPEWKALSTGDYNGDGFADVLLRSDDGWVTNWLGTASGELSNNGANTALFFDASWNVVGTGDFNGDGRDDLLLRNTDGWITNWLATAQGGFTNNGANTSMFLAREWSITSIGDFNGDGKDDLLLRRNDGWLTDWLGTANGSFTTDGNFTTFVATNWANQDNLVVDPRVYGDPGFGAWDY